MLLKPVQRKTVADDVFDQLAGEIYGGRLPAGEALPAERELASALGVNRSAVREALKRLMQAGLIASAHGKANVVRDYRESAGLESLARLLLREDGSVDPLVVRSIMELRLSIGVDAARLAALRGGPRLAARLHEIVAAMERDAKEPSLLQRHAFSLWRAIVEGCENLAYRLAFNSLAIVYERSFDAMTAVLAAEHQGLDRYRALASAVEAWDADMAVLAARAILSVGEATVLAAVGGGPAT